MEQNTCHRNCLNDVIFHFGRFIFLISTTALYWVALVQPRATAVTRMAGLDVLLMLTLPSAYQSMAAFQHQIAQLWCHWIATLIHYQRITLLRHRDNINTKVRNLVCNLQDKSWESCEWDGSAWNQWVLKPVESWNQSSLVHKTESDAFEVNLTLDMS